VARGPQSTVSLASTPPPIVFFVFYLVELSLSLSLSVFLWVYLFQYLSSLIFFFLVFDGV